MIKLIEIKEINCHSSSYKNSKTGVEDFDKAVKDGYTDVVSHKIVQSFDDYSNITITNTSIILSKPKGIKTKL